VLLGLNASALYAGVALGGGLGGLALTVTGSAAALCWLAAGIEMAAAAIVWATRGAFRAGAR
jgi:DHA1 family inner membrane transport protein